MTRRRSGWLILLAVVAAVVGGAFAVRAREKRKQSAPPAPPTPPPATVAPPRTDAERSLVRMAIGGGVFVLLAIATVVVTAPRGHGAGPVTLAGGDGARVEVDVRAQGERLTPGIFPGRRNLVYVVELHNTGQGWVGTRLDRDAWAGDSTGGRYPANQMMSLEGAPAGSTDPGENPAWRLQPGWSIGRLLVFTVPQGVRPARLHLVLTMGGGTRTLDWDL